MSSKAFLASDNLDTGLVARLRGAQGLFLVKQPWGCYVRWGWRVACDPAESSTQPGISASRGRRYSRLLGSWKPERVWGMHDGAGVPKLPYTRWVPSGVGSHSLPGTEVPDTTGYQELVQVSWIRLGTRQSPVEGPVETLPFVPPPVSEGHQLPPAHLLLQ